MGYITMTTLAFGVVLSAVAGLVCYFGAGPLDTHIGWLPHADVLLSHPQGALGLGGVLTLVGIMCQPARVK